MRYGTIQFRFKRQLIFPKISGKDKEDFVTKHALIGGRARLLITPRFEWNNFKMIKQLQSEAWGGKKGMNIHHLREIHDSNSKPPKQTQISTIFLIKLFEYHGLFYKVTLQLCEIMTSLLNRSTHTHSSFLTIHSVNKIPIQYGSIFNVIFTKNKFQDDAFSLRSKTCICWCMHTWPEFI